MHKLMIAIAMTMLLPASGPTWAAGERMQLARAKKETKRRRFSPHETLKTIRRQFRLGNIGKKETWTRLAQLHRNGRQLGLQDRVSLLQMQSHMLLDGGYPIVSAIYAAQAIKIAKNPGAREARHAWKILRKISKHRPLQNLLEVVAGNVSVKSFKGSGAPVFGSDWYYLKGNAYVKSGKPEKAIAVYDRLKIDDRYFFPAKYQAAMIHLQKDRRGEAVTDLKSILYPTSQNMSSLSEDKRQRMTDYANLALGRIFYETKDFKKSIYAFRQIGRDSPNFYDALFEQSWSFFMGGYPMHSLGALYSVESPFFQEVFNPEAPILRALVNYWLCRYDDARNALADFSERHAKDVDALNQFLDRKHLSAETAYQTFENLVSGVSSVSLGIPRGVLKTAAQKDSMMLVRDQYAAVIEEKEKLEAQGIFGTSRGLGTPKAYMERWAGALREDIGTKFLAELRNLKRNYDRLYSQAQFLYVELLMSEKEQLLGKELHASSKITHVNEKLKVGGWGDETQSWKNLEKGEYWWDEVGWYISPVEPKCAAR